MIDGIFILQRESGLTLFYTNLLEKKNDDNPSADLFSGALTGIRCLLSECKIGEINEFTTNDHRIEMRTDNIIVIVIVADLLDPPHEILDLMAEDILVLFMKMYRNSVVNFSGETKQFAGFEKILADYIKVTLEETKQKARSEILHEHKVNSEKFNVPLIQSHTTGGLDSTINLMPLIDWLKNRYNLKAEIHTDQKLLCPSNKESIPVSILFDGGERKLSKIDKWIATRIGKAGYREIILVFGLNPTHGPATIRSILEKIQYLGDPEYSENLEYYPWFPTEILFIGPAIQKCTFDGLEDLIRLYRNEMILVPNYTDHIHREHSPHHAFYRCTISGWKWKVDNLTTENFPIQIFPEIDNK